MSVEKGSREYMMLLTKKLHEHRVITSCMTCVHFADLAERCNLADERPPARVIAYGCPSWDDGLITGE